MKALTLWQPWASLVAMGVKKYEFRRWPGRRALIGERIVIHAGKRPADPSEMRELLSDRGGLAASLGTSGAGAVSAEDEARAFLVATLAGGWIPYGAGIAVVTLGPPQRAIDLFRAQMDPAGIDPDMWAWPMLDVETFRKPVPARGKQGFWEWEPQADLFEHGGASA